MSEMYCIEDPTPAKLRGQYENADGTFLVVQWLECRLEDECKPPEEITAFK